MAYLELIEQYREEMIETLKGLIMIRSVEEPAVTERLQEGKEAVYMPFGKGVHEAFQYMLLKAKADGFDTENIDNYGGHIEFGGFVLDEEGELIGTSNEVMGILGHLDVVPEGNNWDFPPYAGEISDGKMYGRGTIDDKGPVVAAYFAMKALKDSGFIPEKKVRLILGLDEETKWKGMEKYFAKVKPPTFGFTPDAEFPAIHGEMGILVFEIAKKMGKSTVKGLELRSFKGGEAANMVADYARVVLRDDRKDAYEKIKDAISAYRSEKSYKINVKGVGKRLEITTQGISSHGSRPADGLNAVSIMMEFLGRLEFANDDVNDFIDFYNDHIGFELDGTRMGCGLCDEVSGKLIFNVGMVSMDSEAGRLTINVRYPVTSSEEAVYEAMMPLMNRHNLGIVKEKHQSPIYFPADGEIITEMMDVYRTHTGDKESKPIVIGGGTYARTTENIVAFGMTFPGDPEIAHQKNEYIDLDKMVLSAKIYADTIYRLTKQQTEQECEK